MMTITPTELQLAFELRKRATEMLMIRMPKALQNDDEAARAWREENSTKALADAVKEITDIVRFFRGTP